MPRPGTLRASALLLSALGGCAAPQTDAAPTSVTVDSAGVTIVTSRAPARDSAATWSVAPEPLLSIGVVEGDERYMMFRVTSAARLSDGSLAVANSGTQEVRVYTADGSHQRTIGREGDGPGEFRAVSQLLPLSGDTLLVWDGATFRMIWFAPDGSLIRDATVDRGRITAGLRAPLFGLAVRLLPDGGLRVVLNHLGGAPGGGDSATRHVPSPAVGRDPRVD